MLPKYLLIVLSFTLQSELALAADLPSDPTRPSAYSAPIMAKPVVKRNYDVSYIKAHPTASSAIINGQHVGIGSRVDGALVLAITPEIVRLRTPSGIRTVRLAEAFGVQKEIKK